VFEVDNANSILLNRFFTRNTFKQIINDGESSAYVATIRRYIVDPASKTNKECISEIYQHLKKEYQNEYYYKNTLLNKLLLGIHSPRTTTALTEVPVGNSKADFILINGKAVVYEIKTALDNFDRLAGQIEDYYKAFSRVVVVTSEKSFDDAQHRLQNSPVGICLLTKKGTLSARKESSEYCDMLSKSIMFKILRKNEYEQILLKHFGLLPNVSQFEYYRSCQAMFESLPTGVAYQMFVQTLKLRAKIDIVEYAKIPYELKFLTYFSNYKKSDYAKLCRFLST
jgi:hypothetical protein